MALQQEAPPTYSHDPDTLQLPSVPLKELPSAAAAEGVHLPDFKSLRLPESTRHHFSSPQTNGDINQWPAPTALNHNVFPQVPTGALRSGMEDVGSPMDMDAGNEESTTAYPRAASVSMEDPDVRTAAEALTGLRSPSNRSVALPPPANMSPSHGEPEPLLSLLTSSHPWLGGTINGSISAYTTTKHYSPRFVRNVAESVERNIGTPVANTVSAVGKKTGVEDGLRRYLGTHRRPSDLERGDAEGELNTKRRRLDSSMEGVETEPGTNTPLSLRTRTDSQASHPESLPAYDDHRSPNYEEIGPEEALVPSNPQQGEERRAWSTQLMITTSGLGAALNETALKNLKYCLSLLRAATQRIGEVMNALKMVIEDYEKVQRGAAESGAANPDGMVITAEDHEERSRQLADRMKELGTTIWQTLQSVVDKVSRHAGGALPANAQHIVRGQLTSMPYRWQRSTAASDQGSSSEVKNANRMLAFAKEGLDMMGQVSKVVDGTIVSAEQWLDRMGKKPRRDEEMVDGSTVKEKPFEASGPDTYGPLTNEKS